MKDMKCRIFPRIGMLGAWVMAAAAMGPSTPVFAQSGGATNGVFEIFVDNLAPGAEWAFDSPHSGVRKGGPGNPATSTTNYFYVSKNNPIKMKGLSLPIRENPGPGEFRYVSFAWIQWGDDQLAFRFHPEGSDKDSESFVYYAGEGEVFEGKKVFPVSEDSGGGWVYMTRDLWKDFGDFTLTGVSFVSLNARDAGFDNIVLARTKADLAGAPPILPTGYHELRPAADDEEIAIGAADTYTEDEGEYQPVKIDWAAQIKAGGWMMYPLYLVALIAIVIAVQRMLTVREGNLAPKALRTAVRGLIARGEFDAAIKACDQYPSTLADSLHFILEHRQAGMEVVSQSAGDIAGRDIRGHLARIYPLSVISSLSPLLGLLGTIVGMIGAFAKVALYGDEGGAAVLSDDISKALITTAAGLIIAAPSIAIYFVIKNRIMSLASVIEVEIENTVTAMFLKGDQPKDSAVNPEG